MAQAMTLQEALKEVLKDDQRVSKYEGRVIYEMVMADEKVSKEEQALLQNALRNNHFDKKAFELLSQVLLRSRFD